MGYQPKPMPPFAGAIFQLSWWANEEFEHGDIAKAKRIQKVADRIKLRFERSVGLILSRG